MFPIKYIDNNLVWNKDNEVFAYYELIPYNYSFLSAEQKFIVHDSFRQLIAQSREGKIHALQIATESSIRSMQEQSKKLVTGKLKEVACQKIDEQTEALVSMIGDNQVDYRFFLGFKLMVTEEQLNLKNIKKSVWLTFTEFLHEVNHTLMNDFVSMPNDEINRYMKIEKLLENKISRRFKVRRLEINDFGYLMEHLYGRDGIAYEDYEYQLPKKNYKKETLIKYYDLIRPTRCVIEESQRYLRLEHEDKESYVSYFTVNAIVGELDFPSSEIFYFQQQQFTFPVDTSMNVEIVENRKALTTVRNKKKELKDLDNHAYQAGSETSSNVVDALDSVDELETDLDQLNSYKSQVAYYTDMIKKNKEWVLADIYADEAITGTQVAKREDFQRMINDCMNGEIDMVITKSISRFARNTLDTLKYVRMLKERNIAVYFEDEKINTLTMDGELLLVVLSSVAQQEVENISANVKKGLKMKMKRGELVGFQGCLGYDYHKDTKTITVNEEEAEIVRYIFNRYIEGAGGSVIAHELENLGYKTKYGSSTWVQSTVIGIIKNEKYKGDLLLGKTFTVDPISKRRLENFGEEDKFYIRNHHEPIISEEVFEKAQEILARRNVNRGKIGEGNTKREKYSRKYAFSCMLECGFCGGTLTRRNWHSSSQYSKVIWQCVTATKKGKKFCKHSKGIPETAIEEAFVESYRLLCDDNKDVLEEFLQRMDDTLSSSAVSKQLAKAEKEIDALEKKKSKLVDMRLEEIIDKETYESKYADLVSKQEQLVEERQKLQETSDNEKDIKKRLKEFKKTLEQNEVLDKFDRYVFESIVEKVIVGGLDENGNVDPAQLIFVYKTGLKNSVDGAKFKPQRKNARGRHRTDELCSHDSNEVDKMCSDSSNDTCGDGSTAFPQKARRTYQRKS